MARARLTDSDFELARQLEWENMTDAQLKKARETWVAGDAVQQDDNSRVWRVRSYSQSRFSGGDGKKFHFVTLVQDAGYPAFHCTCKHGQNSRFATCWHAKTVARIYRILVEQRKKQIMEEKRNELRGRR